MEEDNNLINKENSYFNEYIRELKVTLRTDYYTLTWAALRNDQFIGTSIKGKNIFLTPANFLSLYSYFIIFIFSMIVTIFLLLRNMILNDEYFIGGTPMILLRMILAGFAHKLLSAEFMEGYYKFKYTLNNQNEFAHVGFALMVGISQMVVITISIISIMLWICMADNYIMPISGFAAFSVLACFDDWIGDTILKEKIKGVKYLRKEEKDEIINKIHELSYMNYNNIAMNIHIDNKTASLQPQSENDKYDTDDLNNRMNLFQKLASINTDELVLYISDEDFYDNWFLRVLFNYIDWSIVASLLMIPTSLFMPIIHDFLVYYLR